MRHPAELAVLAYRQIPAPVRGVVSVNSTSALALAAIRSGGGWRAFFSYARPRLVFTPRLGLWWDESWDNPRGR